MMTEDLPQCVDYQKAIFESLCRIEVILGRGCPDRPGPVVSALTIDEAANALRVSRSKIKGLIGEAHIEDWPRKALDGYRRPGRISLNLRVLRGDLRCAGAPLWL
jgi:hypothetical protein